MPTSNSPESPTPIDRGRRTDHRIRPKNQEKLLTARMSDEQRDFVKDVVHDLGFASVAEWILTRADEDSRRVSRSGRGGAATLSGDNSTTHEGPHRANGGAPQAKAGPTVTAAAG